MEDNMEKPWIKTIKTPFGRYIYDVNRNEIISVNENVYNDLEYCLNNEVYDSSDETKALIKNGFFTPRIRLEESEILHPLLKQKLLRNMSMLCLQMTQRCNLRCEYCVYSEERNLGQRSHNNKSITFETAKKGIDFYAEHSVDENVNYIAFYGGEPLLEFTLIKKCVEYSEKVFEGKILKFSITTNGTLLNPEIVKFLNDHNFKTMISLDGPEKIHDRYRVFGNSKRGTFNIIKNNIKFIKTNYPEYYKTILINSVVNPENDLYEIDHLRKDDLLGDVDIKYSIVDYTYDNTLSKNMLPKKYKEDYEYNMFLARLNHYGILKSKDKILKYILKNSEMLDENADKVLKEMYTAPSIPTGQCLVGQTKLFLDCEGNFYPCEKVAESELLRIGNINKGFDFDKITSLLNSWTLTKNECENCWALRLCGLCIHGSYKDGELSRTCRLSNCKTSKKTAENFLLSKIQEFEICRYFKKYLRKTNY